MTVCEVCGNDYDKPIELAFGDARHSFDCFECAIHAMAPRCEHCGVTVIGHGHEADGRFFCSAHCASAEGIDQLVDRADAIRTA
jgi:hypothetical protein